MYVHVATVGLASEIVEIFTSKCRNGVQKYIISNFNATYVVLMGVCECYISRTGGWNVTGVVRSEYLGTIFLITLLS